jgi:hypothetical protein
MKILTDLTAATTTESPEKPRNIARAMQDEPVAGFFRTISLGECGVVVHHGPVAVCIPPAELLRLAVTAEPLLAGPAAGQAEG